MPEKKFLAIPLDLKAATDSGEFEGLLSVYGNVDLGGDIVEPGAFKEIVTTPDGSLRILDGHDVRAPVGKGTLTDMPTGLWIAGKLDLAVARARELLSLMRSGILNGLSIGFDVLPGGAEIRQDGVRLLKALKLWEGSLVVFPMHPGARVMAVKSIENVRTIGDWERILRGHGISKRKARAMALGDWKIITGAEPEPDPQDLLERFNAIKANN